MVEALLQWGLACYGVNWSRRSRSKREREPRERHKIMKISHWNVGREKIFQSKTFHGINRNMINVKPFERTTKTTLVVRRVRDLSIRCHKANITNLDLLDVFIHVSPIQPSIHLAWKIYTLVIKSWAYNTTTFSVMDLGSELALGNNDGY